MQIWSSSQERRLVIAELCVLKSALEIAQKGLGEHDVTDEGGEEIGSPERIRVEAAEFRIEKFFDRRHYLTHVLIGRAPSVHTKATLLFDYRRQQPHPRRLRIEMDKALSTDILISP